MRALIGNWDLILSVIFAGLFLWAMLTSKRPLDDVQTAFVGAAAFGLTVLAAAVVTGRWVSDRVKNDYYGQLLRTLDPNEKQVQKPTYIVASTGLLTSGVSIVLFITYEEFSRTLTVFLYAGLLFLVIYSILGLADLIRVSRRHLSRMSELQAMSEEDERRRRGKK